VYDNPFGTPLERALRRLGSTGRRRPGRRVE
jgi:hypothetical protein